MKKQVIVIIICFVLILTAVSFAQDVSTAPTPMLTSEIDNSTAPPILLGPTESDIGLNGTVTNGQIFLKQLGIWFTFDSQKKIDAEIDLARLRLIQAKNAAEHNDSWTVQNAMDAHQKLMNNIRDGISRFKNASDAKGLNDSADGLLEFQQKMQLQGMRIFYLTQILQNTNFTSEQRARINERIDIAENATMRIQDIEMTKLNDLRARFRAVANLTNGQINQILEIMRTRIYNDNIRALGPMMRVTNETIPPNEMRRNITNVGRIPPRFNGTMPRPGQMPMRRLNGTVPPMPDASVLSSENTTTNS